MLLLRSKGQGVLAAALPLEPSHEAEPMGEVHALIWGRQENLLPRTNSAIHMNLRGLLKHVDRNHRTNRLIVLKMLEFTLLRLAGTDTFSNRNAANKCQIYD